MNKNERLAALLADVMKFYKQEPSKFLMDVWLNAMECYEFEEISKAFSKHLVTPEDGRWMPKPADIVKQLSGTVSDKAQIAWGKAFSAISTAGAYQDVVFDDPAIHATIEGLGGWPKFCRGDMDSLGYLQTAFCKGYQAYKGTGQFMYPARLCGDRSPDYEYQKKGIPIPLPHYIGNKEDAIKVLRNGGTATMAIEIQKQLA